MRQLFVPQDFTVPQQKDFDDYYLIPITTKDTLEDREVLTSNADIIVQVRGLGTVRTEWPFDGSRIYLANKEIPSSVI